MLLPLRLLLAINALATAAAGIVLFVWPAAIPATVGIALAPESYFVAWLLGSAELGLAALCLAALRSTELETLRLVSRVMIVTHAFATLADALALAQGLSPTVIGLNLAVRLLMVALFWRFGVRALRSAPSETA